MSATQDLREALELIKTMVCGDRAPYWNSGMAVTGARASIADICDAALAPLAENGWMPIETAPRDGTPVLLHRAPGEWPFVGFWGNPYRYHKKGKEAWIGHEYGLLEDKDGLVWKHLEIPS